MVEIWKDIEDLEGYQVSNTGKVRNHSRNDYIMKPFTNIYGYLVGKKIVILGSGDISLIMARRMTVEGAKVLGVVEICPYSNGLNRYIVQCLNDYNIPLYLSHSVTDVQLNKEGSRVRKVTISKVDENKKVIKGSEVLMLLII